jgi:hypothetical protein
MLTKISTSKDQQQVPQEIVTSRIIKELVSPREQEWALSEDSEITHRLKEIETVLTIHNKIRR